MTRWIRWAVWVALSAGPLWAADPVVGNVVGGHDSIQVTATQKGNQWDFSSDTGKKGTVLLTIDELRQAQSIFLSCMRMDPSGLPNVRSFPIGTVQGITFEVQKQTNGRTVLVESHAGGSAHQLTLDDAGQSQMQSLFISALTAQRQAGGPRGADSTGSAVTPDPNTIDNAKDIMHHWHP